MQEAVERVEDKVDLLRDILDAERDCEIIGANRALRRRAQHLGFDSTMPDADWHAIDDIGVAVEQQIERLRSFIRKRLAAAEDEGRKISGRLDAVEHAHDVAETLALLIVAQDSLFLFQQMRVLRIKATQPEFVPAAAYEARALLDQHTIEDADLLQRLRTLVEERVEVEALEVLRFQTASEIARLAPKVDETLAWFADQRGLPYESLDVPPLPGAAEVVDEVKERGSAIASGSRRAIGELAARFEAGGGSAKTGPRHRWCSSPAMSLQRCPRRPAMLSRSIRSTRLGGSRRPGRRPCPASAGPERAMRWRRATSSRVEPPQLRTRSDGSCEAPPLRRVLGTSGRQGSRPLTPYSIQTFAP